MNNKITVENERSIKDILKQTKEVLASVRKARDEFEKTKDLIEKKNKQGNMKSGR